MISILESKIEVDGTTITLAFLTEIVDHPDGTADPRVQVVCRGCGKRRMVKDVGLVQTDPGVITIAPFCCACREIMGRSR